MKSKYFFCYDLLMADWLVNKKRYPFITKAQHPKTKQIYFLMEQSDRLGKLIKEYKLDKKQKQNML